MRKRTGTRVSGDPEREVKDWQMPLGGEFSRTPGGLAGRMSIQPQAHLLLGLW